MQKAVTGISRVLAIISALSIVVLMLAITTDVVVRFFTNASLPGMLELAESSLVVAIFFGLALAGVRGEHVAVTLLADRLSERWNRIFDRVVWALSSLFLAWLLYASIDRAIDATEQAEERFGLIRWPLWPLRWVIVIGIGAFLLVAIVNLIRTLTGHKPMGAGSELELAILQEEELEEEAEELEELEAGHEHATADNESPAKPSRPSDPTSGKADA